MAGFDNSYLLMDQYMHHISTNKHLGEYYI